jgi:hypothetical protein
MARVYRPGDRVFAFTDRPDLVLSLICQAPEQWAVTVFDFGEKKAAISDHREPSFDDAKRYAVSFVAEKYGADVSGAAWREALVIRPSGPSG